MSSRSHSVPPATLQRPRERFQSGARDHTPASGDVLIYLDIDGVLNTTAGRVVRQHLDNDLIANLRNILQAIPRAEIMISSSWRLQQPLMEALESRFAAEGIPAPIGSTGQMPLAERDPNSRGDPNSIDAELARLASQRGAEIHASVAARKPRAWIAIDDLDLRPPMCSTLRMGYPTEPKQQMPNDSSCRTSLPPLAARRPFTLAEQRSRLPPHPLAARLPRRRIGHSRGARGSEERVWIDSAHFVHTSEAAGLTIECAEAAVNSLQAQLNVPNKRLPRSNNERACSR